MKDSTFISLAVMAAPNNRDIDRSEIEQRLLTQYKKKYADEATAEKAINEFLEFCSNRTELFVLAAADDKYRFFHRSFFEYFYARYIYQQTDIVEMYKLMEAFDIDSEVFELSVALVKDDQEEKYQALVNHIFNEAVNGLSDDRPNTTAFSMLTLSMQVVDDAYFISQYFELVIKYRHILVNSRSHLNHKLIANWLIKEMERSPGRREQFRGAYRGYCIQYVLDAFYRAGSYIYYSEYRWPVTNRLMINKNDIPFFMCQFANSDDLYVFMESVMGNPASSLLASMNLKLSRQDKRELTKGYNNYEKMPSEIKVRLLKYLTPRGYES